MTVNIAYLDKRLEEWADWVVRRNDHGLGYPKKTIEARLRDDGGLLISGQGLYCEPTNERAEEIEHLIGELHKHDPRLSRSLRAYYLKIGTSKDKARSVGFSYAQFKVFVDMAKSWLAGRFSARRHT